ncbi:hypothetical protein GOP47_0005969 [Adiantum capillus-veneris]|uniref:Uncharacterized protein n=1 Tax=Adiantum capillus-veneris TaxID=13818 RepID=A0A9D4V268_ADICA|nr:hypothetical protein GOP47_0005969 [Adiantum capillus-veneris]
MASYCELGSNKPSHHDGSSLSEDTHILQYLEIGEMQKGWHQEDRQKTQVDNTGHVPQLVDTWNQLSIQKHGWVIRCITYGLMGLISSFQIILLRLKEIRISVICRCLKSLFKN